MNVQPESKDEDESQDGEFDLRGVRVLVVEDEPDSREVIAATLEQYKAEAIAVASAKAGLAALEHFQPDVLVSDIAMPGEDGYSLLERVRFLPPERGGQIPAIALTAYAREEDRQQAFCAGFQQHLSKPIEPAQLATAILNLVRQNKVKFLP
jgi:CheY-like chemotaxis protein